MGDMSRHDEVEDGMGFSGLSPSHEERAQERADKRLHDELAHLRAHRKIADAEIARLRAELADMREIAENWEIKAKQTDIKLAAWAEAILSMIPTLDRLITDYQCVPDASDGDGQSVFDDARTALAKARAALQDATGTPKPEK